MDGVPYVTQPPVQPGEDFTYSFAPPDAGTFFFHPHCATSEQVGRGLVGVLIVDGDTREPFDDDLALVLKDWRIDDSGAYLPFTTLEGTSRAGTYGTLRTVNGLVTPRYTLPRNANVRLRLVNIDPTRIANIRIDGAEAHVIAIDGNAVMPFALDGWRLGPAMRLDLAVRTRDSGTATVSDYQAATPVPLTTLDFQGEAKRSRMWQPLLRAQLPEPDLARAQHCQLELGAGVGLDAPVPELKPIVFSDGRTFDPTDSLCLAGTSLWTLNGQSWPAGGHERLPPPLFSFRRGASIVFELFNATPHAHPLHVHGHTMRFLSSTRLQRPPHWADTILVMPNEHVTVAFVADNPGRWMIHCHIVEHQEAGMMGWFDVS
jgi:FtsP/CotA-like multicopper oxidase with cupredoxin domain